MTQSARATLPVTPYLLDCHENIGKIFFALLVSAPSKCLWTLLFQGHTAEPFHGFCGRHAAAMANIEVHRLWR